ncbi:MAG: Eco57I restriction-modification methylase domain-containing protein [Candidatus Kapaibacterium sp.]
MTLNLFPEERRNTGLFSQYYLDEILLPSFGKNTETAKQADLGFNYFEEKFDSLEPIIRNNAEIAGKRNERQLEEDVIKPILDLLGHHYDVAPHIKGDVPDYILFPSEENKIAAKKLRPESDEYQKLNVGVLDAKSWKISRKAGIMAEANISQIFRYLINFRRRWGILTDGFRWVLFANKTGIRQDQYIEFNLADIVTNDQRSQNPNFRLFIFLFRCEAFSRVPGTDALLDAILDESFRNAEKLQSDLKKKVYEAFGIIAEEYRRYNRLSLASPEEIHEVKESSLIFLYRILFLLFGESRLILPIRPKTQPYYALSLQSLVEDRIDKELNPTPNSTRYWTALEQLFELIHGQENDGSPSRLLEDIGLPVYNGGLFDPHRYPNVAKWKLGDKAVKEVMDLLTKTGEKKKSNGVQRVSVSYRDLGVQHLGNIYEGILENHIIVEDGTVHIVTDKKERKATGSYFTPDYIVDYIVKETLEPLLPKVSEKNAKKKKKSTQHEALDDQLLRIKVLDPAMGSGHFLVGAIDFLAQRLAEIAHPDGLYTEAELQECRRKVAERCIYGVDLNPMAVELAKLSIWLHTISNDKPLTFLDNHIKCGNSLIGARIDDLSTLPETNKKRTSSFSRKRRGVVDPATTQAGLFPEHKLTKEAAQWLAEGRLFKGTSNTIDEVKAKEKLENELDDRRSKYRHLADLWTASYFLDAPQAETSILFRKLSDAIVVNADEAPLPESELLKDVLDIAKERRFFHWDLEFPEIFFDKHGRRVEDEAGFDAVIGNPPYVSANNMELKMRDVIASLPTYQSLSGKWDEYIPFVERAISFLEKRGRFSFIVPYGVLNQPFGRLLREQMVVNCTFESVLDLHEVKVFKEATIPTCIPVVSHGASSLQISIRELINPSAENGEFRERCANPVSSVLSDSLRMIRTEKETITVPISNRLRSDSFEVRENFYVSTGAEIHGREQKTRETRTIKTRSKFASLSLTMRPGLKPYIEGSAIPKSRQGRYCFPNIDYYLDYQPDIMRAPKFPELFESDKIVVRRSAGLVGILATLDHRQIYTSEKCLLIIKTSDLPSDHRGYDSELSDYSLQYLLCLLNSKALNFYYRSAFGGFIDVYPDDLKALPLRRITFITPKKDRVKLTKTLIAQSEKALNGDEQVLQKLQSVIELAKQYSAQKNDVLHDFLSHLAEKMLSMHKEKQKIAQAFFEWLGHYGILPREERKPKSYLDEFWTSNGKRREFGDVLRHLKKNTKKQLSTSTQDDLLKRFTGASEKLNALEKRISNTDWLIDQVVYALYGLTDEEIAIVERS